MLPPGGVGARRTAVLRFCEVWQSPLTPQVPVCPPGGSWKETKATTAAPQPTHVAPAALAGTNVATATPGAPKADALAKLVRVPDAPGTATDIGQYR